MFQYTLFKKGAGSWIWPVGDSLLTLQFWDICSLVFPIGYLFKNVPLPSVIHNKVSTLSFLS